MDTDNNNLNASTEDNSTEQSKDSFFKNQSISNTPSNKPIDVVERRWSILNYITEHPNCSAYQISKELDYSYSLVHEALRQLVFARVVYVKMASDSQGRPIEVFFLPGGKT